MNNGSICFWLALALFLSGCTSSTPTPAGLSGEATIRVLLTRASGKSACRIATTAGYKIQQGSKIVSQGTRLEAQNISLREREIIFDNRNWDDLLLTSLGDSQVIVDGQAYYGDLLVNTDEKGAMQVINIVPMEKYVACVLGGEMPLSWSQEALQAQAIVARTYALYEKLHRARPGFDVYDTVQSQVYKGIDASSIEYARAMVNKTRGMVMLYDNAVFKAFFHSTCGGYTASAAQVFEYSDITPMAGRECPFCTESKFYNWECRTSMADWHLLLTDLKLPQPFLGLAPAAFDRFGRCLQIDIHYGNNQKKTVKAADIRRLIGAERLRSTFFTMTPIDNGILFQGRGWGHGVGMCQFGAGEMGNKGYSALQIVQFYYPGAAVYRLW